MGALGVIGGSGVYSLAELQLGEEIPIETPFGSPSGPVRRGMIGETEVLFLPRHGAGHVYSPTDLPYRANVSALKQLGATHLLSLSAVGSLREDLPPRTLVLPDQIIDRTVSRPRTFFDQGVVAHVGIADPFCHATQGAVLAAAQNASLQVRQGGAYVCIEGPQFSTRAESELFRSWGAAVIGMTAMPEARLAREAELCYAMLAMVTDFDVWHAGESDVSVADVVANMQANSASAAHILREIALSGLPERRCDCATALDHAVMTSPEAITPEARQRVQLFLGTRFLA